MKALLFGFLLCTGLGAQSLSYYIDPSDGAQPASSLQPLSGTYSFPDTSVGSSSSITVRVVNNGAAQASLDVIYVGSAAGSSSASPNFTQVGFQTKSIIAPGDFKLFTLNFSPASTGSLTGYLQASSGTVISAIATLEGNGTPPQLTLACNSTLASQCNGSALQPNSASTISFGTVSTTSSLTIPFTLTNNGSSAVNPQALVAIATTTNNPNSAFSVTNLPTTLASGGSATFDLIFAPGTAQTYHTNLLVGTISYSIQASGIASVLGDISSLVITYTDANGVRLTAQPFLHRLRKSGLRGIKFQCTAVHSLKSADDCSSGNSIDLVRDRRCICHQLCTVATGQHLSGQFDYFQGRVHAIIDRCIYRHDQHWQQSL